MFIPKTISKKKTWAEKLKAFWLKSCKSFKFRKEGTNFKGWRGRDIKKRKKYTEDDLGRLIKSWHIKWHFYVDLKWHENLRYNFKSTATSSQKNKEDFSWKG